MKSLIIYDLDGTIIDTAEDIALAIQFMQKTLNCPVMSREEVRRYVGHGLNHLIGCCLSSDDEKMIERGARLFKDHYAEHMLDHSRFFEGVLEFFEFYRTRMQAVLTNKPNPYAKQMLERLGAAEYFKEIIAGNSGFPYKPNPASIYYLLETYKLSADNVVLIGDSAIDIELARAGGIEVMTLSHGFTDEKDLAAAKPDGIFPDFKSLFEYSKKAGW